MRPRGQKQTQSQNGQPGRPGLGKGGRRPGSSQELRAVPQSMLEPWSQEGLSLCKPATAHEGGQGRVGTTSPSTPPTHQQRERGWG